MTTDSIKPVTIKADIFWANLNKVNEMSGKYQVDLGNLSPQAVDALNAMGIEVKYKEEKGDFITCKSTRPIIAFDTDKQEIDTDTIRVANGSKAKATIKPWTWTYQRKSGTSPSLVKLVITDLITLDVEETDDDVL